MALPRSIAAPSWNTTSQSLRRARSPRRPAGLGHEHHVERLVDMGGDRLAGDDAALLERREQPALGADRVAVARQDGMGFEPVERGQTEPLGDRPPLRVVGDEVDPLAVANLVEPKRDGRNRRSSAFSRRDRAHVGAARARPRIAQRPAVWPSASGRRRRRRRLSLAAPAQSPACRPPRATARPGARARRPACARFARAGSPMPISRCSASITSTKRSVSATGPPRPSSPPCSSRTVTSATIVASTRIGRRSCPAPAPSRYQCGSRASAVPSRTGPRPAPGRR